MAAVITVLALFSVIALSNASASTKVTTSTYLLYVGHDVGVAARRIPTLVAARFPHH